MKWYYWILAVYVFMVFTWTWYLAAMNLIRIRDENPEAINIYVKVFAYPYLIIGLISDALLNITLGTILFFELPSIERLLFTARLDEHAVNGSGWRKSQAQWWCDNFLNAFDPNCHCGCKK